MPAVGLALALMFAVDILRDGARNVRRVGNQVSVTVPGEDQILTIDEPGGYTIGLIGIDLPRDAEDRERLAESLALEVVPVAGGAPLPLARYQGFSAVESTAAGGRYVPLRTVRFEQRGDYLLRSRPQPKLDRERTVLVLNRSPFREMARALRSAAILSTAAVFLAVLVTVILARARGRSRRAIRAAGPPPPTWTAPMGGPPPGGPPSLGGPPGPWPPAGRP